MAQYCETSSESAAPAASTAAQSRKELRWSRLMRAVS